MNRLFLRFFVLVMLAMSLATGVIYFTFNRLFGDPIEEIAARQASGQIFLLEQYIDQAPSDEWLTRLNKVREVSALKLELLPLATALDALPRAKREALQRGALVLDVAGKAFYRRVDLAGARYIDSEREVLHAQGLPIDIGLALRMEAIRFLIIAGFLLLPICLWSRAHWRGLQALSQAAEDFGQGRLSARAALAPSASLYPLAARMNQMAGRIEALLEARKHLLRAVSHELRTPIARIEFGLELLRTAAANPALDERIVAMEGDVRELEALVSELLTLTQLEHAAARPGPPFSVDEVLRASVAARQAGLRGTTLEADIGAGLGLLAGERRLFARALDNVLGNAVKYARGRVALRAHRLDAERVEVLIEDDGPGIPAAERLRILEPFYRLERDRDHAAGGFGLGLSIAHKALLIHQTSLDIGDSSLGGARVRLCIACRAA